MRGRYRILLGMAAGVGKTYRMLQEGRQAQQEGVDVVIGYLEPHDRPETAALAEGIEAVRHLRSTHGGLELSEMDVDGVIARGPELALVDELAHTNVPEARNRKRYEDIDEILEAGIDVTSTVNIQHLESLNDDVFELTGVRVRETFPDRILDEADEVVLVDLAPEALQERVRAGKVYAPDRVEAALGNFFRVENLAALRELVLRELAEDVEARRGTTVLDPLSQQAVAERILVLVTPEARSQRILRRAFRSGQRLGSDIDALWVRRPGQRAERGRDRRAGGAAPAGEHPRRALHRAGVGRPDRGREVRGRRARLDLRLRRHAGRVAPEGDPARLARRQARSRAARRRHPRRRRPRPARGAAAVSVALVAVAVAVAAVAAALGAVEWRRRRRGAGGRRRVARILVPFTGGALDQTVLDAAIRIARAEEAKLVPAYLIVIPLEQPEDSPARQQVTIAMPLLEAVEHAALRAGVPVDARVESGRTPIHALQRLWEIERFDRIVVPAPVGRKHGFTPKDLTWMLTHAPSETLILRPDPAKLAANGGAARAIT